MPKPEALPAPDRRSYIIGDVHGCTEPLLRLLDVIERDAGTEPFQIVLIGDYVDRGPDSAGTLRLLYSFGDEVHCLMGNHDRMLLDVLETKEKTPVPPPEGTTARQMRARVLAADESAPLARWLPFGGEATLTSFGVSKKSAPQEQVAALRAAVGEDLIAWLANRPMWWKSGNVVAVHAYTNPAVSMDHQDESSLLWARPPRRQTPRRDKLWVVHGHVIVSEPRISAGHISIDTGAYRGNPLSAVALDGGEPRFLNSQG